MSQPAQVMKAYDENPNKMTLIKTEQEVKEEEQERLEEYGLQELVKQEPKEESDYEENNEFYSGVSCVPYFEELDPEERCGKSS